MKRILFVGGGKDFPEGAFRFLQSMQDEGKISVTGLFFSSIDVESMNTTAHIPIAAPYVRLRQKELEELQANKAVFARKCSDLYLKHHVHPNVEAWDTHLFARESRFADLVVLGGEQFYSEVDPSQPNLFLREALHAAECPVMIIPSDFAAPQQLVIAYDGSRDSLYAIRQFCYLFPAYTELPTEIIYVKEDSSKEMPDLELLQDFTRQHFSSLGFSRLHFKAARYFAGWIGDKKNVMLISGSFGRSPFSYLARESFSREVVHDHRMPLFIAHN